MKVHLARAMAAYLIRTSKIEKETLKEKMLLLPQALKENIMTTYDQILAEGIEKGRLEGQQEGILKGQLEEKVQAAENCLKKGLDQEMTAEITGLPLAEIK